MQIPTDQYNALKRKELRYEELTRQIQANSLPLELQAVFTKVGIDTTQDVKAILATLKSVSKTALIKAIDEVIL